MEIITNHVPRDIIYGYELTEKEREQFDYLEMNERLNNEFFRYKGEVYDLNDGFEAPTSVAARHFKEWDGWQSDSFFSGILIKYVNDFEQVIVGRYYS